jgi:hypothetical protein
MSEHFRTDTHQFVDSEVWMIMDESCGIERLFNGGNFYGSKEEAMKIISGRGWVNRRIAVRMECVQGFEFDTVDADSSPQLLEPPE